MSERANGRARGPVLTSLFLFVPDHSASGGKDGNRGWKKGKGDREKVVDMMGG